MLSSPSWHSGFSSTRCAFDSDVGIADGFVVGLEVGEKDGTALGVPVGDFVGEADGADDFAHS